MPGRLSGLFVQCGRQQLTGNAGGAPVFLCPPAVDVSAGQGRNALVANGRPLGQIGIVTCPPIQFDCGARAGGNLLKSGRRSGCPPEGATVHQGMA